MSLPKKMTVQCSKCGAEIDVTVFESVNTDYSTDITEQIISGDLFNAKCGKCGFVSHLEYDVLYHDVKHGAMIWVLHDSSPEYFSKVAELRSSANILGYKTTRIVSNMNELRQKVACLENGRDDRVIELCKVFIAYNLLSKQPDFEFNNAFYTNFLDQERVFLYDKNGQELSCELTDDIYSMLSEMYYNSEYASDFQGYYALVDYDWAESVIQPLLKQEAERIDAKNAASSAPTSNSSTTEKKVVCPKCKQPLPEDSVFCHYCGTSLAEKAPSNKPVSTPVTNTTVHNTPSIQKSKNKPFVIGVILSGIIILLAIALICVWPSKENESIKAPSVEEYSVGLRSITMSTKDTAEDIYAKWEKDGQTEDAMVSLMDKYGAEQGGGIVRIISPGEYVDEIDSWCFDRSRKTGDAAIIKNPYGYTICYISSFEEKKIDPQYNVPAYNDSQLTPVPEPETAFVFENRLCQNGVAPLEILTSSEDGYYFVVDLVSLPDGHGLDDFSKEYYEIAAKIKFYVRGGDSLELNLPLGTYEIYYATGQTWFGEEYLFGANTIYHKCDDEFVFSKNEDGYSGWTIKLYPVASGNLDTDIIDRSDFPN